MTPNEKIPLWSQLQVTAQTLGEVRKGVSATAALEGVEPVLRPGVQALLFAVLRSLGRADALCKVLASRRPPAPIDALLCTALALAWNKAEAPYEPFTLVNQAVEAAKRSSKLRPQAGFINGCLRRFLREQDALVLLTAKLPEALWNHPLWWIERLQKDHPDCWQEILTANNRQPPMTLRVNARHCNQDQYLQTLEKNGVRGSAAGHFGVVLDKPLAVQAVPGFLAGDVSVQDGAAQMAAPLLLSGLSGRPGLRVLDACAAPGGKTAHLLEISGASVTALEIDAQRCQRIETTLSRLGLRASVIHADASMPASWWDGDLFDAILLDAPCTASGIVRRHPDVRWLRRQSDVDQLVAIQSRLLKALWPLVRPKGRLLYCTCSVFKAEGEAQIQTFLANNTEARLLPSPGHLMPYFCEENHTVQHNSHGDNDGFYYALLEKDLA